MSTKCNETAVVDDLDSVGATPATGNTSSASVGIHLCYVGPARGRAVALRAAFEAAGNESHAVAAPAEVCTDVDAPHAVVVANCDQRCDLQSALTEITSRTPHAKIVVLAHFEHGDEFLDALHAGASGFCDPSASADAVARTVRDVIRNGVAIPRQLAVHLVRRVRLGPGRLVHTSAGPVQLTERESDVLFHLRAGLSTNEIADTMYISAGTIRSHVLSLVRKFGVDDRESLLALLADD